tara:strand:- start:27 stop:182 length:156 start_codon:yes stop_codon:yes gene_type:complete
MANHSWVLVGARGDSVRINLRIKKNIEKKRIVENITAMPDREIGSEIADSR